jgi:hypothetical protein
MILPDFKTALALAHKSNAPVSYWAGDKVLTIDPEKVPELMAKLAEKHDPGGKKARGMSVGCMLVILAILALLAMVILKGGA